MGFNLKELLARNPDLAKANKPKNKAGKPTESRRRDSVGAVTTQTSQDRRVLAGRVAAKRGASWEDEVRDENKIALAMHQALVTKLDPPSRVVRGKGGSLRIIYQEKGGADWIGVALGYPVAFETKAVDAVNSYTVMKKNENQLAFLRNYKNICDSVGSYAIVGYYVFWRNSGEKRFHPIETLKGRTIKRLDGRLVDSWIEAARMHRE